MQPIGHMDKMMTNQKLANYDKAKIITFCYTLSHCLFFHLHVCSSVLRTDAREEEVVHNTAENDGVSLPARTDCYQGK